MSDTYCQHGHTMAPGELLARYCYVCLWAEIARLTAEVERMRTVVDAAVVLKEFESGDDDDGLKREELILAVTEAACALDGEP